MSDQDDKANLTGLPTAAVPPVPQPRLSRPTFLGRLATGIQDAEEHVQGNIQTRSTGLNVAITVAHLVGACLIWFGVVLLVRSTWWQDQLAPATSLSTKVIALIVVGVPTFIGCVVLSQTGTSAALSGLGNFLSKLLPFARSNGGT